MSCKYYLSVTEVADLFREILWPWEQVISLLHCDAEGLELSFKKIEGCVCVCVCGTVFIDQKIWICK